MLLNEVVPPQVPENKQQTPKPLAQFPEADPPEVDFYEEHIWVISE